MKYEKVVGKQIPDGWVLFKLPNGTAAYVDQDGDYGFFYSWAQALRFTMIDARGSGCVPADQLREAIEVLKQVKDTDEEYKRASKEREKFTQGGDNFLDKLEKEHEEWCENARTHPDGSLVWGYDE